METVTTSDSIPWHLLEKGRSITGMSAVLLPFFAGGEVDWHSLAKLIEHTIDAGLIPAVNMDTGYANLITETQRIKVLEITRQVTSGKPFLAGAFGPRRIRGCVQHRCVLQTDGFD